MKNKITSGIAVCALAFTPIAFASSSMKVEEGYVGIEAIQTNQNYKTGFGNKIFKKNPQDYSVFGGFKFHKHFGAEVGFEFQPKRNKDASLSASDSFPGQTAQGTPFTTHSSIKNTSPYLGLFGEHKAHFSGFGNMKFQALIGASVTHVHAHHGTTSVDGTAFTPSEYAESVKTYTKTRVVPMVKLSATYMATDHVGIRVTGNYRNMSAFKIKAKENPAYILKLRDSFGVGLGLTYSFCK